jgi:hypothetical protein
MTLLVLLTLVCAAVPAVLFLINLRLYRAPSSRQAPPVPCAVSVLIPARNEEATIHDAVRSILDGHPLDGSAFTVEVVVLDDHSRDKTATIVQEISREDGRVRLVSAPPLPEGWSGKQHACHVLAREARHPILVFLDADVRMEPGALLPVAGFLATSSAALASGFPRQVTGTLIEKVMLPLMHFVLLGFLPLGRMRRSTSPAYAAGCGQLFVTRREDYERAGGHAAIRETLHDGIRLPRAYREKGLHTDLFDATHLARCRMYRGPRELIPGLLKNSREGMGSPGLIIPFTILLGLGQVLPLPLLVFLITRTGNGVHLEAGLAALAVGLSILPRFVAAWRFRQSFLGAVLHPLGVLALLVVQWAGLFLPILGWAPAWKGRRYEKSPPPVVPG